MAKTRSKQVSKVERRPALAKGGRGGREGGTNEKRGKSVRGGGGEWWTDMLQESVSETARWRQRESERRIGQRARTSESESEREGGREREGERGSERE